MDFPTFEKNATKPTEALVVTPPEVTADSSAEERWLAQQWRDVKEKGIAEAHPLSINRDSDHVTTDPYTT